MTEKIIIINLKECKKMDQTFMKEKPVLPLIMSMALPMVISMLVNSLYNIVDSFFVAKISENAMTALSLVYPIQNFVNAAAIGFGVGINAIISFYNGAGNINMANKAATQGLILNTVHGIILTVVCIGVMPGFIKMYTSDMEIISLGIRYSNIVFGFSVIVALGLSFEKIFQSVGKMAVSMISMLCGCIANIVLDPVFIFGFGFIPPMGIEGAAIATVIGQVLTLVIYIIIYIARPINVRIGMKYSKPDSEIIKKLYVIGVSSTLNLALPSLLISALNAILSVYSQIYVLVLGVYYKLQTFLYLPANGIVQGMRPIVGYNYGAREYKRVRDIYITGLVMIVLIMAFGMVLCLTLPGQLMGLFTSNSETLKAGVTALSIISLGFIASSVSVTSSGTLEGLGMGLPSLVISLLRYVIIIIPTAFILSRLVGAEGVWYAFVIAELITAAASVLIYKCAVKS